VGLTQTGKSSKSRRFLWLLPKEKVRKMKYKRYLKCHFWLEDGREGQVRWLMPVILATQKAEIRRIMVQVQPRQKSS
jgi:hypothetical protein